MSSHFFITQTRQQNQLTSIMLHKTEEKENEEKKVDKSCEKNSSKSTK